MIRSHQTIAQNYRETGKTMMGTALSKAPRLALLSVLIGVNALGPLQVRAEPRHSNGGSGRAGIEQASSAMFSQRVTLGVGKTVILDLPAEASEIVVGDPKVANAVVRSAKKLYLMAVGTGQTTIMAIDREGRQVANIELNIGRDLDELEKLLRTALPKSRIVVKQVNDSVVLTGDAGTPGEAATAMDIAKAFSMKSGGGEHSVVNAITLRGQDQVMVKVTIAEVQRTILKQLGVSTSATTPDSLLRTSWATLTQQNPFALNGNMTNGALTIPLGTSTSATLQAFERYGVSRTLSEPTVTAVSGESAKFTVGGELPIPTSSSCSVTTCTTGLTYKPYGVSLNITPVVIAEGRILIRMASEVTEVDTTQTVTINSIAVPGFRTRKNETSVELPSGGSLATAGLITNNSRQAINGTPGLLNLPILGALFRSRDYQRQETELLIVVTPYIVRAIAPKDVVRPDDGFSDASDPQAWLLGRMNKLYSSRSNPQAIQNWKGRFGFIQD